MRLFLLGIFISEPVAIILQILRLGYSHPLLPVDVTVNINFEVMIMSVFYLEVACMHRYMLHHMDV